MVSHSVLATFKRVPLLIAVFAWMPLNAVAQSSWRPVTLAPDLKVVSIEFGAFPVGKGPQDRKGKAVVFQPTEGVNKTGFSYGWKIKFDTPRKTVHVYPLWAHHAKEQTVQLGAAVGIVDGCVYQDWDESMGTRKGKHSVTVCIEGKLVKTLDYFVD